MLGSDGGGGGVGEQQSLVLCALLLLRFRFHQPRKASSSRNLAQTNVIFERADGDDGDGDMWVS